MKVTALQLDTIWEDKPANHRKIMELLSRQDVEKNSLLVLPEMFDTGFSMNTAATAQSPQRESEAFLRELAAHFQCAVIAGVAAPLEGQQSKNEAVAFAPDGSELVRYRKIHPFTLTGEDIHYGAGDRHALFEWQDVMISPFICYDLRFPELFRPAAAAGAEFFVVMACWPQARSEHWVRLLQARAIENQAYVLGVNRCGSDPNFQYDGRSAAFDPLGQCLFEADATEQIFTIDVDPTAVRRWREKFPALRDMRPTDTAKL